MVNSHLRITSVINAHSLDSTITGLPTFNLSDLNLLSDVDFELPTNLRLGHLAETIVSKLIHSSTNYNIRYENIQLLEAKKTIGEIDFILEENYTKQLFHMELAYKFYLYDPNISSESVHNWVGPNRNDSLIKKLDKTKNKQFPLLYHNCSKLKFDKINLDNVSQVLCLLASLYIPYECKASFSSSYQKAIKGYYLTIDKFISLNNTEKMYFLPSKQAWGMDPAKNKTWLEFYEIENQLKNSIKEKQALLCWQKYGDSFISFFIVWW
jgi:hypothetical protein